MKKIFSVIMLICLLFSGCKMKEYTPVIPSAFKNEAVVYTGDFSFNCEICKTQSSVYVTVTSTNAKGMKMEYNGSELSFTYDDFSYSLDAKEFEKSNVAVIVYDVFDYINSSEQSNVQKLDLAFKYDGKISAGNFTFIQNDDNSLRSIEIKENDFKIEFQN